jgi:glucose-6-phosphate 1-dehydrogenase
MTAARNFTPERVKAECVRGQYGPGSIDGKPVPGYRQEEGVAPDSTTETFAMLTMYFDNWRWAGVPFYIRSGKRLPKRVTEIAIQFQAAPHQLFGTEVMDQVTPNQLIIRIQPDEGITLRFAVKVPGQITHIRDVNMDFRYGTSFGVQLAEAYERLLLDCILGDSTLYARKDMTERGCTNAGCRGVVGGPVKDMIQLQQLPPIAPVHGAGRRRAKCRDDKLQNLL